MSPDPRRVLAGRVYYGWIIVFAALLATTAIYGTSYAFGVFYDVFIEEFDVPRSALAAVFGFQTALIYVVGVVAGRAISRYGHRLVAVVSSFLFTTGLLWTALSRSYLELLVAFGFLTALGMGGLFVVSFATIPLWFEKRRGTASGIASAGLGIGMAVFPLGADLLISSIGWRWAMFGIVLVASVLCFGFAAFFANRPSDVGADASVEFGGGRSPFEALEAHPTDTTSLRSNETIWSVPFLLVFLSWILLGAPVYIVISHVVTYTTAIGIGRAEGVLALTTIGVVSTAARFGIGALADRVGRPRTFIVCMGIVGGGMFGITFASTPGFFLGTIVLFGVGYGGCSSLFSPLVADLFGHDDINITFAVMSLSFAVAGLLAPPFAGMWFEATGSYTGVFMIVSLGIFVGAGCVTAASRLI